MFNKYFGNGCFVCRSPGIGRQVLQRDGKPVNGGIPGGVGHYFGRGQFQGVLAVLQVKGESCYSHPLPCAVRVDGAAGVLYDGVEAKPERLRTLPPLFASIQPDSYLFGKWSNVFFARQQTHCQQGQERRIDLCHTGLTRGNCKTLHHLFARMLHRQAPTAKALRLYVTCALLQGFYEHGLRTSAEFFR